LQKANRRAAAEKTVHKIEAGAIAFVVAKPSASAQAGHTPPQIESFSARSERI